MKTLQLISTSKVEPHNIQFRHYIALKWSYPQYARTSFSSFVLADLFLYLLMHIVYINIKAK